MMIEAFLLQSSSIFTNYSVLNTWLPVVVFGMIISLMLIGVYYMVGYMINQKGMKDAAVRELGQVLGAGIIIAIIIAALPIFAGLFSSLVSKTVTTQTCTTLAGSQVNVLSGFPTSSVCNYVEETNTGFNLNPFTDITPQLDYGLASTYVIIANMTNQSVENLNALYVFENFVGYLQSFKSITQWCMPGTCVDGTTPRILTIAYGFMPLSGYSFILNALKPVQTQSIFVFEMLMLQLLIIIIMLFTWPYFLAAGMILKATVFGRRIGGTMIAIAIVALIVFPAVYLIEYSVLTNPSTQPIGIGGPASIISSITGSNINTQGVLGTSAIPSNTNTFNALAISELPLNDDYSEPSNSIAGETQYLFQPFILPKLDRVIYASGCWPEAPVSAKAIIGMGSGKYTSVPLIGGEAVFAVYYLIPAVGAATGLLNLGAAALGFSNNLPFTPTTCTPNNLLSAYYSILNVYGVTSIIGIFIPILNILIAITAVRSIAYLLGGDTNILGIGRLL
jgi:hypothetical protein